MVAERVPSLGRFVDEPAVRRIAFDDALGDARQDGDVAADSRLKVMAGDLGAEEKAAQIRRYAEVDEAGLLERIDDDDIAAVSTDLHHRAHQARMVRRRVAADQEEHVGILHVFENDGCRTGSDGLVETDAAGLMAVIRTVVDVIGAVKSGEQLQEKGGLVGRAAAGVEESLVGRCRLDSSCDEIEGFVPVDDAIVGVVGTGVERMDDSARGLELARRKRAKFLETVAPEEFAAKAVLHVGGHGLEGFLADFGPVTGLVAHAALLTAHAERAGLAGVLRSHGAPEPGPADAIGDLECVLDRGPAAAGREFSHEGFPVRGEVV